MRTHLFIIALFLFVGISPAQAFLDDLLGEAPFKQDTLSIHTQRGETFSFKIELATTPTQHQKGLMNRKALPEDAGMLFVFPGDAKPAFWMKNTLIPLDMLFITKEGTIRHIHHRAQPLDETQITAEYEVRAVLEINGGMADKLGIGVGDTVIYKTFRNSLAKPAAPMLGH
ncbi:MAG: DUF192 domain-containing protein [Alphaproteobacteria bacterium]|nr:DUF192 domain-containing protein [Alphaproteobacteria bacterium]